MKFTNYIASNVRKGTKCEMAAGVKTEKFCLKIHELKQSRREASSLNSKRDSKIKKYLEWQRNGDKDMFATLLSYTPTCIFLCCSKSI